MHLIVILLCHLSDILKTATWSGKICHKLSPDQLQMTGHPDHVFIFQTSEAILPSISAQKSSCEYHQILHVVLGV